MGSQRIRKKMDQLLIQVTFLLALVYLEIIEAEDLQASGLFVLCVVDTVK